MAEIVQLTPEDWEALRELRLHGIKDSPCAFGRSYEEEADKDESFWRERLAKSVYLGVKEEEKLVGMMCYLVGEGSKYKHIVNIHGVYVRSEMRGKGYGKLLMKEALDRIEKIPGIVKVCLSVTTTQASAIGLYESLGFKKIATLEKEMYQNEKYIDVYEMAKMLA